MSVLTQKERETTEWSFSAFSFNCRSVRVAEWCQHLACNFVLDPEFAGGVLPLCKSKETNLRQKNHVGNRRGVSRPHS